MILHDNYAGVNRLRLVEFIFAFGALPSLKNHIYVSADKACIGVLTNRYDLCLALFFAY